MDMETLKRAVKDTIPVMTGYVALGAGFGIIMKASGYGIWLSLAMSVFIYAGSMQYVAVGLFTGGASLLSVALTTLIVNARHLFYGISMIDRYKDTGVRKPYLIFSLTDETYSIVCHGNHPASYYLAVSALDQFYWVAGTWIGAVLGGAIQFNTEGIDFALTALFITVFTEQWLASENHFPAITGVVTSVLCLRIFGVDNFLIPTMLFMMAIFTIKGRVAGEGAKYE